MEMGAGRAAGGADLGNWLTGKDMRADLKGWLADKVTVADGEIAVLEFDEIAGAGVVADGEDFSRKHGVDWCAGLSREVESGVMFMATFAEGISASAETGGDM